MDSQPNEKECPRCAETIKAKAVVCRYCRHEMGIEVARPAAPGRSAWDRSSVWIIVGAIVVGIVFTSFITEAPAEEVDINEVERLFDRIGDAAVTRYVGKPVIAHGVVASVHRDRLTLKSDFILNIQAEFAGSTSGISEGDRVTLRCAALEADEWPTGPKPRLKSCCRS